MDHQIRSSSQYIINLFQQRKAVLVLAKVKFLDLGAHPRCHGRRFFNCNAVRASILFYSRAAVQSVTQWDPSLMMMLANLKMAVFWLYPATISRLPYVSRSDAEAIDLRLGVDPIWQWGAKSGSELTIIDRCHDLSCLAGGSLLSLSPRLSTRVSSTALNNLYLIVSLYSYYVNKTSFGLKSDQHHNGLAFVPWMAITSGTTGSCKSDLCTATNKPIYFH